MIIAELSSNILIDEVSNVAQPQEVYFLSHLFGTETLKIPHDWPGTIYTSQFIRHILCTKKSLYDSSGRQEVNPKRLKVLEPNVPIKLRYNDKIIKVTMFETEEITNNVMFLFDDESETYLYTGIFSEIGGLYKNEEFMNCVQKGIDNVYINTTRCNSKPYVSAEDTVQEIKRITQCNPDSKIAVVIPTYGYERLLMQLVKEFPHKVRPTINQSAVLRKLGCEQLGKAVDSRIFIHPPGIGTDLIKSNSFVVVYIAERKCSETSAFGLYLQQWSPFPSVMDLRALLDIIRPKKIFPIKSVSLETNLTLPREFIWFTDTASTKSDKGTSDHDDSDESSVSESSSTQSKSIKSLGSEATTIVFQNERASFNKKSQSNARRTKSRKLDEKVESQKEDSSPKRNLGSNIDFTVKRTRVIRHRTEFIFTDSDED